MSFWDNVKKFAQPYADDDYDDYDDGDEPEVSTRKVTSSKETSFLRLFLSKL